MLKSHKSLLRKSHFLGTKIRNLRKRNNLTIEDLSSRCIRINPEYAPSVSYLSMIERGKRVPSFDMLEVVASVFQKDPEWFLDDVPEQQDITPDKGGKGGINGMPLEPSFLFSQDILQIAIPEMLSQTGVSGRQFAHLLIRAHQENNQNHFPDLERAAEDVGQKRMPLSIDDLKAIAKQVGLTIKWFEQDVSPSMDDFGVMTNNLTSSYLEPGKKLFLNKILLKYPMRLKYELAVHIGHAVLHNQDSIQSVMSVGGHQRNDNNASSATGVDAQDILNAWHDFESSFFAGALLCPKVPFRQLLDRHGYEIASHVSAEVSASVAMRRMTAVSPYSHWHYFDAYSPGKLKAVYRGNGIPLPWGNMTKVDDPCQHWAVFNMISQPKSGTSAQLSIMRVYGEPRIYVCESINVKDMANNNHVLCAGIDLNPAIQAQGTNATELAEEIQHNCVARGGSAGLKKSQKSELMSVARILNINWVERAIDSEAKLICSRGNVCPRKPSCYG